MTRTERSLPVTLRCRGNRVDRTALSRLVGCLLDSEKAPLGRGVGLILVGRRTIRRLNRDWRGCDDVTDVLSFPWGDVLPLPPGPSDPDDPELFLIGEVVICLPRCREQATAQNVDAGVELVRLVVHGVLHALGHDHQTAREIKRMGPRERRYRAWAKRNGVGPGLLRPA